MHRCPHSSRVLVVVGLLFPTILAAQSGTSSDLLKGSTRPVLDVAPSSYVFTSVLPGNARTKSCALLQDCAGLSAADWTNEFTAPASTARHIFKDAIVSRQLDINHPADDPISERDPGDGHGKGNGNNGNHGNSGNSGSQGNGGGNDNGGGNGNDGNGNGGSGGSGSTGGVTDPGNGGDPGNVGDPGSGGDGGTIGSEGGGNDEGGVGDPGGGDDGSMGSNGTLPTQTTPEPATVILLATGVAGLAVVRRKRRC